MVQDIQAGTRDRRGYWRPFEKLDYVPVIVWPFRVFAFLKWLVWHPGFICPWNLLCICLTIFVWTYVTPSIESMITLSMDWIGLVFRRNVVLTILIVGTWHFFLYMRKTQNTEFKYNQRWPDQKKTTLFFLKGKL